jgi:hypothetical protein
VVGVTKHSNTATTHGLVDKIQLVVMRFKKTEEEEEEEEETGLFS